MGLGYTERVGKRGLRSPIKYMLAEGARVRVGCAFLSAGAHACHFAWQPTALSHLYGPSLESRGKKEKRLRCN